MAAAGANMAERSHNLIQFERTNTRILFCNICGTHLALEQHLIGRFQPDVHHPDPYVRIHCMVNIVLSDDVFVEGNHVMAQVSCGRCSILMGYRIVDMLVQDGLYVTGEFIVYTKRLLLLNGDRVMDAFTRTPIFRNWWPSVYRFNMLDGNFYLCLWCRTHLALEHDFIETIPQFPQFGVFRTACNNMHTGTMVTTGGFRRARIYCSVCYSMMGMMIAPSDNPQNRIVMLNLRDCAFYDWAGAY